MDPAAETEALLRSMEQGGIPGLAEAQGDDQGGAGPQGQQQHEPSAEPRRGR